MTSHRGTSATVLRAPDRPACPAQTARLSAGCAAEADGAPYVRPLEYLVARDVCPAECGDRHRTGAEAQSTPPPDAKGSGWVDEPPNYKTRLVVATLPSSRLSQKPDAKAGVAMMKHTLTQAWLFILITPALARAALDLG